MMSNSLEQIISFENLPHKWCPGCGNGTILSNLARAISELNIENEKLVIVSGIGCSGRASKFFNTFSVHTTHGRPIAFATGIKLANPTLKVIVLMGDGDCGAIGGNHFIHGCRRNVDLTVVIFNNSIYGMTGGQSSPTSNLDAITTTTPSGNSDPPLDLCELAKAAGATYIARGMTSSAPALSKLFQKGIEHNGFSVIDVFTQCTVHYGRRNGMKSATQMLEKQKDICLPRSKWEKLSETKQGEKYPMGVLFTRTSDDFYTRYQKRCNDLKQNKE